MPRRLTSAELAQRLQSLAGCVQLRYARSTGALVAIFQPGTQAGGECWITSCETHSTTAEHPTIRLARWHAPSPEGWCEACRGK